MRRYSEERLKVAEVETKLSGECPIHHGSWINGVCYDCVRYKENVIEIDAGKMCEKHRRSFWDGKCHKCEWEKAVASPIGVIYNDHAKEEAELKLLEQYKEAELEALKKARKRFTLPVLHGERARQAIKLVAEVLGRHPNLNTTADQSGHAYNHRTVLWNVDLQDMVKASNALSAAGFDEFKVTTNRWLTLWIDLSITVVDVLGRRKRKPKVVNLETSNSKPEE